MDLTKLSVVELKALAYDTLAQIEQLQRNLQVINGEIAEKLKQEDEVQHDT